MAHLWLPRGGPCEDAPEKSLGKTQQEGSPGKHENPRLEAHPETDTRRGELVPAPHPSKSSAEEHERASAEHARSLRTWSAPTGDEHCDAVQRERERAGSLGVTGARLATPKRTSKEELVFPRVGCARAACSHQRRPARFPLQSGADLRARQGGSNIESQIRSQCARFLF